MAVVVQRMVEARREAGEALVAGVLFTDNPAAGGAAGGQMVVEASWGVGEAVVSGRVDPDRIVLDKATGAVVTAAIGAKEVRLTDAGEEAVAAEQRARLCLGERPLKQLWAMARRAEEVFGPGQDIEWALVARPGGAEGELYCLQIRPITARGTSDVAGEVAEGLRAERAAGRGPWARHNLGETVPQPTPLTWDVLRRFMSGAGGFGTLHRLAGYAPSPAVDRDGFLTLIAGRIYMDLGRAPAMFGDRFPLAYDVDRLRRRPEEAQGRPTAAVGRVRRRWRGNRLIARASRQMAGLMPTLDREVAERHVPAFRAWAEGEARRDLAGLSPEGWAEAWHDRDRRVMAEFAPWSLLPGMAYARALDDLRAFLAERFWDEDAAMTATLLALDAEPDATVRMNEGLYRVAAGELSAAAWLDDFGHRGSAGGLGEMDLATARWREVPGAVDRFAAALRGGERPAAAHRRQVDAAAAAQARLRGALRAGDGRTFDTLVAAARRYARFREDGKHELMRGVALLRAMVVDAARRLGTTPGEIALLTEDELFAAVRDGTLPADAITARRVRRAAEGRVALPAVIDTPEIDRLAAPPAAPADTGGGRWSGTGVAGGHARGRVWRVLSPDAAAPGAAPPPGYVLVCPSTDPSWTPLFINAAAVVLDRGGMLSHGAVLARELGKPAVVLADATGHLADGDDVTVDGGAGVVARGAAAVGGGGAAADDDRVAPAQAPPPEGRLERLGVRLTVVGLVGWGLYLLIMWLAPRSGWWEAAVAVLDRVFWPLVRAVGPWWAVAILAGWTAAVSMACQWAWTDVRRLRVAKARGKALRDEAHTLPEGSPRDVALLALAAQADWRVARAGFVPLAVLLGPMMLMFFWLPERIDPAVANPLPGAVVTVTATVPGEFAGELSAAPAGGAALEAGETARVSVPAARPLLEALERELAAAGEHGPLPAALAARLEGTGKARGDLLQDLRATLAGPLPPQTFSWRVRTPADRAGAFPVTIDVQGEGEARGRPAEARVVTGLAAPPPLGAAEEAGGRVVRTTPRDGPVQSVAVHFVDPRRPEDRAFWRPFAWAGWRWDAGWLGLYLAVYIAAMVLLRRALRIP
jgi:pyruvate,water dikinase